MDAGQVVTRQPLLVRTIVREAGRAGLPGAVDVAMAVAALCTVSRLVRQLALAEFRWWYRRFGDAREDVFAALRVSVHAHPNLTASGFDSFVAFMYTLTRATEPGIARPRPEFELLEIKRAVAECGDRLLWGALVAVAARRLSPDELASLAWRVFEGDRILSRPRAGRLQVEYVENADDPFEGLAMGMSPPADMEQPHRINRDVFPHWDRRQVALDAQRMIDFLYSKHTPAVPPLTCNLGVRLLCGYPGPSHLGIDRDTMLATLKKWVRMSPGMWAPGKVTSMVNNKLLTNAIFNALERGYDRDFKLAAVLCGLVKGLDNALWSFAIRDSAKKTLATALLAAGIHCTRSRLNLDSAPYARAFFATVAGQVAASKNRRRAAHKVGRLG